VPAQRWSKDLNGYALLREGRTVTASPGPPTTRRSFTLRKIQSANATINSSGTSWEPSSTIFSMKRRTNCSTSASSARATKR
jgi:hypothetical protein